MEQNFFPGKRILFISAKFFNYEKEIKKKLEEMGAHVDYYDERPGNDFLTKSLIRINRKFLFKKNNDYYNSIINETASTQYDIVFIIRGEVISQANLERLRKVQPNAKFILYLWDALSYSPNSKKIKGLFDQVYTFDRDDSITYPDMKFRPLFYIDEYKDIAQSQKDIDVLFIGTVHTDRYKILSKIEKQMKEAGFNYFFYKYYPNKLLFHLKRIFDGDFKNVKVQDFHFKGLSKEEVLHYYARAKVIIDIERPKQNGLTMRTVEAFGAKKKLITTNLSIQNYDLYHPNNILIVDRDQPDIDLSFISQDYLDIKRKVYEKYSIVYWLTEVLTGEPQEINRRKSMAT